MMIRPILTVGAIALALIGLNGCGKEAVNQQAGGLTAANKTTAGGRTTSARTAVAASFDSSGGLAATVAAVASYHNSGMSYVYNSLQSSWPSTKITSTTVAQQFINTFVSTSQNYVNVTLGIVGTPPFTFNIFGPNYKHFDYTTTTIPSYIQSQTGTALSFAVSNGLNSLQSIIVNNNDPVSISSQCRSLVNTVLPTLSTTTDSILFLGATDVAIQSASYWYTSSNVSMWQAYAIRITGPSPALAMQFANDPEGPGPSNGDIVKGAILADLVGAARGVVTGALAGGAGGTIAIPGVGTVTGAAAGGLWGMASGAVTASVSTGVLGAFAKWVGW